MLLRSSREDEGLMKVLFLVQKEQRAILIVCTMASPPIASAIPAG